MSIVIAVGPQTTFTTTKSGPTHYRTPHMTTLAEFIRRIATKAKGYGQKEITCLISAIVAAELGFPATIGGSVAFLEPVRTAGFRVARELFPFMTFHSHPDLPSVHLGVTPWIEEADRKIRERQRKKFPLYLADDIPGSIQLMSQWQSETGCAYRGGPGVNAVAILRSQHNAESRNCPTWKPRNQPDIPLVTDPPLLPQSWQAVDHTLDELRDTDREYLDMNGAYLGRYITQPVPRWGLRKTGPLPDIYVPNPKGGRTPLGGWFLIKPSVWNEARMPHPAGPDILYPERGQEIEPVWRTAPTLALLDELTERGLYGGYKILDSWTSKAYKDLAPMGEKLRDIIYSGEHPAPLIATAKAAAQEFHGQTATDGGMIVRPDWYATIRASARTTLWRRALQAGLTEDRWPLYFKIDAAFYRAGELPDINQFPRKAGLGGFKVMTRKAGDPL